MNLLPDLDGYVHGIVGIDPWVIQCDGCGRVAIGESRTAHDRHTNSVILFCGIQFGDVARDPRRLCATCRVAAGWHDYDTDQCRTDAKTLAFHEAYMQDPPLAVVILPAPAPRTGMALYWASRALDGDYGPLSDEDREMAEAASARAMDVQLGVAGKGQVGHLRESFPIGDVIRREEEEAAAAVEDGALFGLGTLS